MASNAGPPAPEKYQANHGWLGLAGSSLFVSYFCRIKELERPPGYGELMKVKPGQIVRNIPKNMPAHPVITTGVDKHGRPLLAMISHDAKPFKHWKPIEGFPAHVVGALRRAGIRGGINVGKPDRLTFGEELHRRKPYKKLPENVVDEIRMMQS
ncbi:hypothetical protein CPB86DRAFT_818191 [Serendipita vermifera]|nr:hypothetical protein CPB86DRAFT_818191 [Serendipita vermifera]